MDVYKFVMVIYLILIGRDHVIISSLLNDGTVSFLKDYFNFNTVQCVPILAIDH